MDHPQRTISSYSRYRSLFIIKYILPVTLALVSLAAASEELNLKEIAVVSAEELVVLASNNDKLLLIDSRISSDRGRGYIEGSINLPDTRTNCHSLLNITENYSQPIVFYCNGPGCARSKKALNIAKRCGFTNLYWFSGGIKEWKAKRFVYLK